MIPVGRGKALSGLAIAAGLSLVAGTAIRAQSGAPASTGQPTPTFTKDVLPILQRLLSAVPPSRHARRRCRS